MYLQSLKIENIRAIKQMELDFRDESGRAARRWTVLLGENGCGKSTVLKSIALVLAGSEALPDLLGPTEQWVRNGARQAHIEATIATAAGDERMVALTIRRGAGRDSVIKQNAKSLALLDQAVRHTDRNYFVAGYGAFRRPPDMSRIAGSSGPSFQGRAGNLATMFMNSELISLEQWALDLDYASDSKGRDLIAQTLGTLLPGMEFKDIDKLGRSVIMSTVDGSVPLRQLSEGYQAMAAWAGDLLFRITTSFRNYKNPLAARGVLLLDEMDLHLHPVWKRKLVDFLTSAFPNLQIVATTHSPLSVHQCGEGELFVVRREDDVPKLIPFGGNPSKLRLSDLFLSPLIGLDTLDSPKVAALRQEARDIELKAGKKTPKELGRLRSIEQQLDDVPLLAPAEAPMLSRLVQMVGQLRHPESWPSGDDGLRTGALSGMLAQRPSSAERKGQRTAVTKNAGKTVPNGKPAVARKEAAKKSASARKSGSTVKK